MGTGKEEPSNVSLVQLKSLSQQMLPMSSNLRDIILSEPDSLTKQEALVLMPVFVKMLYKEVGRT